MCNCKGFLSVVLLCLTHPTICLNAFFLMQTCVCGYAQNKKFIFWIVLARIAMELSSMNLDSFPNENDTSFVAHQNQAV